MHLLHYFSRRAPALVLWAKVTLPDKKRADLTKIRRADGFLPGQNGPEANMSIPAHHPDPSHSSGLAPVHHKHSMDPGSLALGRDYPRGGLPAQMQFGGRPATLRLLRPEDERRFIAFFNSHTPETIRSRYGYSINGMSPQRAARMLGVNQDWDAAIGVFETEGPDECLIAVGRACRERALNAAELAFVVSENRRRLGVAAALLRALAALMRQRGVNHLFAQVQQDNEAMLALFRRAGAALRSIPGTGDVQVSLSSEPDSDQTTLNVEAGASRGPTSADHQLNLRPKSELSGCTKNARKAPICEAPHG
jgi:GNAT superfamily N-acetyltransferase